MNIMDHTADNIQTQITLLLSFFSIFNMHMWYYEENLEEVQLSW